MNVRSATGGHRPHLLLIDDTPEEIQPLLVQLRAQPWRITVASDPRQGYQRALALRPDLILLDVRMPQMDGFTLCRLLREAPATQRTPVIFLSSAGAVEERLEGLQLGGVDYVLKPCEPAEVLARIRIHLQLTWRTPQQPPTAESPEGVEAEQVVLLAAMRFIEQNLGELPSLGEIARKVGTHDKRLSGIFRERLDTTVFAYIREVRLRRAQELLAEGSMSIQDIADLLGFRSACNFTTAFRERTGTTPSGFRRTLQGNAAVERAEPR
ncbi:helix-turn-helix domain-containing protein [Pseudomonas sp. PS02288]|uniref:helix-turn-helix domain-containing protein n=1 Tax=Pseudomonas sp. PS02288 TaxID=2991443 RepID=UPI00249AE652|nr:helix-turn-helix domain-containing protein [Pseudomonas sp. PS02288]